MRDLGPIQWRFVGDEKLCRELLGPARTLLGVLRSTLAPGVNTGALSQRLSDTSAIRAALFGGIPVVTIEAYTDEQMIATKKKPKLFFALFEMVFGTNPFVDYPGLGINSNSLVVSHDEAPEWFRAAADAAVYSGTKKYPSAVPDSHALHQYADYRFGVTVSCGYGPIPYCADRSIGVAVNGRLITSALSSVIAFSADYCMAPRILSVTGGVVVFTFISAPAAAVSFSPICMYMVSYNITTGAASLITFRRISYIYVAHPAFGFYYSPDGSKCCGIVVASDLGSGGFRLQEITYTISADDGLITSSDNDPYFSYTNELSYDINVGCYYNDAGVKTYVKMKPEQSFNASLDNIDNPFSYSGIVTFEFNVFGSHVSYSPERNIWNISYINNYTSSSETCLYRGNDKWITLCKGETAASTSYSYDSRVSFSFTGSGDIISYGVELINPTKIGSETTNTTLRRIARLGACNLEKGSYVLSETEENTTASVDIVFPNHSELSSWVYEDVDEISPNEEWSVSLHGLSSAAPWARDNDSRITSQELFMRHKIATLAGEMTIEESSSDIPQKANFYISSDYSFALDSYFSQTILYSPRTRVPPSYTSSVPANDPIKFGDFFINLLEYWGYGDRYIRYEEDMATGFPRYMTEEQYKNHLIGTGALYELAGNSDPVSFAAINTYSGIHVLMDGKDITDSLPVGGSGTFAPCGVI